MIHDIVAACLIFALGIVVGFKFGRVSERFPALITLADVPGLTYDEDEETRQ